MVINVLSATQFIWYSKFMNIVIDLFIKKNCGLDRITFLYVCTDKSKFGYNYILAHTFFFFF